MKEYNAYINDQVTKLVINEWTIPYSIQVHYLTLELGLQLWPAYKTLNNIVMIWSGITVSTQELRRNDPVKFTLSLSQLFLPGLGNMYTVHG